MPKTTTPLLVEDFYKTTLSLDVNPTGDVELTVTAPPSNKKGFIIVDPESSANRERMYYHDVIGNVIYVKGVNRVDPKEHFALDKVQINDTSLIFNYLSELQSTTFYVEQLDVLDVNIWGGPVLQGIETISVADQLLTLTDAATNYIYYKPSTNEIKTAVAEATVTTDKGIIVADIVAASGAITSISYRKNGLTTGISIDTVILTSTSADGLIDTYTITFTDATTTTFDVTNGNAITDVSLTSTSPNGLVDTYTITFQDATTTTFDVTNGNAITDISLTSTSPNGLVDTYTITFQDDTTTTFDVTNGNAITDVSLTSTSPNGLVDTYTITFQDDTTTTFDVTNGNGISDISLTDTVGNVDTYTITFQDNTTTTFDVTNGTGIVNSVVGGASIDIDNTDPKNPIVNFNGSLYATKEEVAEGDLTYNASSTGTDAYQVNIPNVDELKNGMKLLVKSDVANTGASTLEVIGSAGSLGAVAVKKEQGSTDLTTGDWKANGIAVVVYNSSGPVWQFSSQVAIVAVPEVNYLTLNSISNTTINKNETIYVKDESFVVGDAVNTESIGTTSNKLKVGFPVHFISQKLNDLLLRLKKVGTPVDSVTYRIETDNSGEPSGNLVNAGSDGTLDLSTLTTSFSDVNLTLNSTADILTNGLYWIVLERVSPEVSNYLDVNFTDKINIDGETSKIWDGSNWVDSIIGSDVVETINSSRNITDFSDSITYFTPNTNITLKEVDLTRGVGPGNIEAELRQGTTVLEVPTYGGSGVITFGGGTVLSAGTQYNLKFTGGESSSCDTSGATYPLVKTDYTINSSTGGFGANLNYGNPETWTTATVESLDFSNNKVYTDPQTVISSLGELSRADDLTKKETTGVAKSGVTKFQDLVIANIGNKDGFSGLDPNTIYYLSDTPGQIQDTPGTNTVVIGKTKGDPTILILDID